MDADTPADYRTERIREVLAADVRVSELDVQVALRGGKAFVTGNVTTSDRRDAITTVIGEIAPDLEVVNEVSVADFGEPDTAEVLS